MTTEADSARVNIKSVYRRIRDLATAISSSPQRRKLLQTVVALKQKESTVDTMIKDVDT